MKKDISRNNLYSLLYASVSCLGLNKSIIRPVYKTNSRNKLITFQPTVFGIVFFCGISHHSYNYNKTVIENFRYKGYKLLEILLNFKYMWNLILLHNGVLTTERISNSFET